MKHKLINLKSLFITIAVVGTVLLTVQFFNAQNFSTLEPLRSSKFVWFALLAIALQMLGHWIRAIKERYLLEQIRPIPTGGVFKGQMIGFFFNSILPFRIGELVRAHYIGKGVSISRSAVFATILFERCLDALVLGFVGLGLLAFFATDSSLLYVTITLFTTATILAFVLHAARSQQHWLLKLVYHFSWQFNKRTRDRIRFMVWSAIYCLKSVITRPRMPRYVGLTVIMWVCYILSTFSLIVGLLPGLDGGQRILASIGTYFAVSVPSGPAYLGTFEDIFLSISNLPGTTTNAIYAAFALWLLLVGPTTIFGLLFLVLKQKVYSDKKANMVDALKNKLYRDRDITEEFSRFLDAYFKGDAINRVLATQELGDNFRVIKTFKGGSNALTILAWQNDELLVKKITLKQYQDKLQAQHDWLKSRAKLPQIAKVVGEHNTTEHYALDIQYREEYIPFFDYIHSSSMNDSWSVLQAVCDFVDKKVHTPKKPNKRAKKLVNEYLRTKAIGKVNDSAKANIAISNLKGHESLVVNGREVVNFDQIIKKITSHKQAMADLSDIVECPIHGDLTIDNIIVEPHSREFILLDPNNENAISDPVVDYAKLMQGLHSGYDFLFTLDAAKVNDNQVNFEERRSVQYDQLHRKLMERLQKQLPPSRYRTVLFHEAIHYCRMLTYRVNINPESAPAFYGVAVRLFNDFMEQYDQPRAKKG